MNSIPYLFRRILIVEIGLLENNEIQIHVYRVTYNKRGVQSKELDFKKFEGLKNKIIILSIYGTSVIEKKYTKDESSNDKIIYNEQLLYEITQIDHQPSRIAFIRKDALLDIYDKIEKSNIVVLKKWISTNRLSNFDQKITSFYKNDFSFKMLKKDTSLLNSLLTNLYLQLRLPVLLSLFAVLFANFFLFNMLNQKYQEQLQTANSAKTEQHIKMKKHNEIKRLLHDYTAVNTHLSLAQVADRIACFIPPGIKLTSMKINPAKLSKFKDEKIKISYNTIKITGEVKLPGSLVLFSQNLKQDNLFTQVNIDEISKEKDTENFGFSMTIKL